MNELIQVIKLLEPDKLKELNDHIDTLEFTDTTVFGKDSDKPRVDTDIRSSKGAALDETHEVTLMYHLQSFVNGGLKMFSL